MTTKDRIKRRAHEKTLATRYETRGMSEEASTRRAHAVAEKREPGRRKRTRGTH
jgi:hypothetical protein